MQAPDWTKVKIEVVHAPKTGSLMAWEVWAAFPDRRVFWSSHKTQESAEKKAANARKKYFPSAGA